jgi:transposase
MQSFLSAAEIITLKQAHRDTHEKRYADRIKTILCLNDGFNYEQISKILQLDDTTLRDYYQQYKQHGLQHLIEDDYKGGFSKLTTIQCKELEKHIEQSLYHQAKDIVNYIAKTYGVIYSVTGVTHLLHHLGFVYKATKAIPGKADLQAQLAFIKKYKRWIRNLKPEDRMYFVDATHPQHNLQTARAWIKKGQDKEMPTNTGRERINIMGALNVQDTEIVTIQNKTINAQTMVELFDELEAKHPVGKIHIIVDNARYNDCTLLKERVKKSRIIMHRLPTYSPNLNIIERLWLFYHRKVLYNKYYPTMDDFQKATTTFFEDIQLYRKELRSLLVDNFQLIGTAT